MAIAERLRIVQDLPGRGMQDNRPRQVDPAAPPSGGAAGRGSTTVVVVPIAIPVADPRRTALRGAAIVGGRTLRRPRLIRRADSVSGEIVIRRSDADDTARVRRR
jgi:hypothetical protein